MTIIFVPSGLRTSSYRKHWPSLVRAYGQTCYYCGEFATCIDHIVPAAYGGSNNFDNLVLACAYCNALASDRVFDDVDEKRDYILRKRESRGKTTRAICTDCLLPYDYLVLSPSLFLCAECIDIQLGKECYSSRPAWARWIRALDEAGVDVSAHRRLREMRIPSRERKIVTLTQLIYYDSE